MRCPLHDGELMPCPICGGVDSYITDKSVKREDVEHHGAWFWFSHCCRWYDKFLEQYRENKRLRREIERFKNNVANANRQGG